MREKESGGPGFHQFSCKQLIVSLREGRGGGPGRVDENVGRKDDKIHKHGIKRIIMLSQDIQLKNSMNQKYVSKCIYPLSTGDQNA